MTWIVVAKLFRNIDLVTHFRSLKTVLGAKNNMYYCEVPSLGLNRLNDGTETEDPTSGWGSLWERFQFSKSMFQDVPGTVAGCVCTCEFKRNSSSLDRAPKMRDSVLLNSCYSFLVTLLSISSETCVIHSPLILGTGTFRDRPFLRFSSCVSFATAANFRLFLLVAIFWREIVQ